MPTSGKLFTFREPLVLEDVKKSLEEVHDTTRVSVVNLEYKYEALELLR